MSREELSRHPLKGASMWITTLVLAMGIWHGICSPFVLMMAAYMKNLFILLLLVSVVTPFVVLVRRVKGKPWSRRDFVMVSLAALPGTAVTFWLAWKGDLLGRSSIVLLLVIYTVSFFGAIPLVRRHAWH